jgi:hypothetical protein
MSNSQRIHRVGPVRVVTALDALRAFRHVGGWREEEGSVPLSFPVVWMKRPEIVEAIHAVAEGMEVLVHETQRFEYSRVLDVDEQYDLMLELMCERERARVTVTAEILALDGTIVGTAVSTLRSLK